MEQIDLMSGEEIIKEYEKALLIESTSTTGGLIGTRKIFLTNKRIFMPVDSENSWSFFYNRSDYEFSQSKKFFTFSSLNTSKFYVKSVDKDSNEVGIWCKQSGIFSFIPRKWKLANTEDSDFIYDSIRKFKVD